MAIILYSICPICFWEDDGSAVCKSGDLKSIKS
ncbi:MAG: CPCC family cysteine-rich protein [Candidatus Saccharibacteria bacterium]